MTDELVGFNVAHASAQTSMGGDGDKPAAGGELTTNHQLIPDVSTRVNSGVFLTVEKSSEVGVQLKAQRKGPKPGMVTET